MDYKAEHPIFICPRAHALYTFKSSDLENAGQKKKTKQQAI